MSVACADDPELLKEVESLLDISSTPPGTTADASGPALTQWEHLTVLAEVGRGAFGRVYRAWDPALQMEVALKLIAVDTRDADFAESVFHEARLLVKVRHPNVVTVLGARRVGAHVGIWMEFINGPTLADAIERGGPMNPVEAAAAGMAVCDALAAVHGAGLLHRDIKARNVMRDAGGRVVLMDFGAGADRRQQPHGEMAGTPLYMAPEVLKGAGASIASDIYSVGVLLFHLATGEYPVSGTNIYELEAAHESGARVWLADRRPELPAAFVAAVDRALSPDPSARFRRAVEFRDALSEATARLTGPVQVPASQLTSDRWLWIAGAALAAGLIAVTFLGFLTSAALNVMLSRDSRFVDESSLEWPIWGIRALLAPVLYMGVMLLFGSLVRWMTIGVRTLIRRFGPRRTGRDTPRATRWSLEPNALIRLVAVVGILALVAIWWQFIDLIEAVTTKIAVAGPEALAPLAPDNAVQRFLYRRALEVTMLIVGVGLYRALRLKRPAGPALDMSATACCIGVLVIAVLLTAIPYRIFLQNRFPRARFDGLRCYVLGRDARETLAYCPESGGPHPRILSADEAARLINEGSNESIFTPAHQAAPSRAQ